LSFTGRYKTNHAWIPSPPVSGQFANSSLKGGGSRCSPGCATPRPHRGAAESRREPLRQLAAPGQAQVAWSLGTCTGLAPSLGPFKNQSFRRPDLGQGMPGGRTTCWEGEGEVAENSPSKRQLFQGLSPHGHPRGDQSFSRGDLT
jgi:hypothetical protein